MNPEIGPSPEIGPAEPSVPSPEIPPTPETVSPENLVESNLESSIEKIAKKPGGHRGEISINETKEMALAREELEEAYESHSPPKVDSEYAREQVGRTSQQENSAEKLNNKTKSEQQRIYEEPKDDFEALGIGPIATDEAIKSAYRKKAIELHPDKHPGEEKVYEERFNRIQQAYENLMKDEEFNIGSPEEEFINKRTYQEKDPGWHDLSDKLDRQREEIETRKRELGEKSRKSWWYRWFGPRF